MKRFSKIIVFILFFVVLIWNEDKIVAPISQFNQDNSYENFQINNDDSSFEKPVEEFSPIFTSEDVPDEVYQRMLGKSIPLKYKNRVDISSLSYLRISYFGFDNDFHVGEMVVNKKLSDDVLAIFRELYDIRYPIEKIRLIDEYDANDELSMTNNNTSCFCYRVIIDSSTISNHAEGMAIDINPLYNPYVSKNSVSPSTGSAYANRSKSFNYKITREDSAYKIFVKHGWSWGRRLALA